MRHAAIIATALTVLGAACASGAQSQTATSDTPEPVAEPADEVPTTAPVVTQVESPAIAIDLQRANHATSMTEVVVDPTAQAGLTIDDAGNVRLWTDLHAETVQTPLALPVFEPVWMSLARQGSGFVAAFIDTAGAARAGRISIGKDGATWTSLFEMPATAPFFEVHVLDGGTRMLALGVDHRVHLWDAEGDDIALLDEAGFVPWQLRINQPKGAAPSLLAVLAGPSRVQRLQLKGDELAVIGDAHLVSLDRGPNRGDLVMSPDGQTVFALRRPKRRSKRFELEAISMTTGERTVFAAESDKRRRPRVHPFDGGRVLLETGSGNAAYVDTAQATPWPPADNAEADRETIDSAALAFFEMKQSTRRSRVHSTVVNNVRVVPMGSNLVVDPLDVDTHRVIERPTMSAVAAALNNDGSRVVWADEDALVLETVGADSASPRIIKGHGKTELLGFVGDDKVVELRDDGHAWVVGLADGLEIANAKLKVQWGIRDSAWRHREGGGQIVVAATKPKAPLSVLGVAHDSFESLLEVPRDQRGAWPEAGSPRNRENRLWLEEIGVAHAALRLRDASILSTVPSPVAHRMVIVQKTKHRDGFDVELDSWVVGPHEFAVTVIDTEASTRVWTRAITGLEDVAWSGNGERLAIATTEGGFVYAAVDGEQVHARNDRGITTNVRPD